MKTTSYALTAAAGIVFACIPAAVFADDDDDDERRGDVNRSGRYVDGNITVRNGTVVI